jgi:osmotically-inducible protein OsmY
MSDGHHNRVRYAEDESRAAQPRASQGFARWWDVQDCVSQAAAPQRARSGYDRTGERRYEAGLRDFERRRAASSPSWELDNGGVQFGRPLPSHRGRGPAYQRSDERVREAVCELLTDATDVDATDIDVQVESGVVLLSGRIDSRHAKRRAEDVAAEAGGVHDVINRLTVADPSADSETVGC